MFKKTKIAAVTAAVLGVSSMAAQAVSVNNAGEQGQVLIFPFYNVHNEFVTGFNIINTTDAYKAVKVRFREGKVSSDVLDFNLYMSPHDVFTMQLKAKIENGEPVTNLTTDDKSCTQPAIPSVAEGGVNFRSVYFVNDPEDLLEGYLEVIEMGEVDETATVIDSNGLAKLVAADGILHNVDGVPFDCNLVHLAWVQGTFMEGGAESNARAIDIKNPAAPTVFRIQNVPSDPDYYGQSEAKGLTKPKGGLVGRSILVDPINITGFVAEPTSIINYSTKAQHYLSSDAKFYLLPSLASGNVKSSEALGFDTLGNPIFNKNTYTTVERDFGLDDFDLTPRNDIPSGINPMPIADAMLVEKLSNEYFLGGGTKTDWVISAPMRKHAIYNNFRYHTDDVGYDPLNGDLAVQLAAGSVSAPDGYWERLDGTDVVGTISYYDREEQTPTTPPSPDDFSPPIGGPALESGDVPFTRETNILVFNNGEVNPSVLGSVLDVRNFSVGDGFENGWATLAFDNPLYDLAGSRYVEWVGLVGQQMSTGGVPVHGFMAADFELGRAFVGETFIHFNSK